MRGRRPTPTAILIARGTFRRDRHGSRIDAPGQPGDTRTRPSEISEAEQAERKRELDAMRKALYGGGRDGSIPGPRSGGSAKRIRW
jgi:hypothetical protein